MTAPLFRFMGWLERRASLCLLCREAPGIEGLHGYCSTECAVFDAEMQAHG